MSGEDWYSQRLSNPDIRCKNRCGFYGNPIYQGYCSKCYREVTSRAAADRTPAASSVARPQEGGSSSSTAEALGFTKFTRRKTLFSTAKGHGKLFKTPLKIRPVGGGAAPPTSGTTPPSSDEHQPQPGKSSKTRRSSDPFNEFMKTLKKPAAQDIVQHLTSFKRQIVERSSSATVDEQSDAVQEFYRSTSERLTSHPLFKSMSEEEQEETMDGIEKHLTTSIYLNLYSPASSDDDIKDLLFVRRINMLHWLGPSILDVVLDMNHREVQAVFEQARQELWNMEAKKAPQDKLNCVTKSCKHLLEALRISHGGPASADEFVPALIFLVIHTSPQHLPSNVNYITRFGSPLRIMSGEGGYYFTNLCGAMAFIDNISAEKLKMSQEEFNSKMGYINGKTDADLLIEEYDQEDELEDIAIMQSCCQAMNDLTDSLKEMITESDNMTSRLEELQVGIREQVHSILSAPPPRSLRQSASPIPTRATGQTGMTTGQTGLPSPPPLMTFD